MTLLLLLLILLLVLVDFTANSDDGIWVDISFNWSKCKPSPKVRVLCMRKDLQADGSLCIGRFQGYLLGVHLPSFCPAKKEALIPPGKGWRVNMQA
jgi:hypothetical protein